MSINRPRVLMIGPSRKSQGGISSVVNGWFDSAMLGKADIRYLNCSIDGSKVAKLAVGCCSLLRTLLFARKFDLVHIHMGGGNSYNRERLFVSAAVDAGVPAVLHIHDGLFRILWEKRSDQAGRKRIRDTLEACDRVVVLSTEMEGYIRDNISAAVRTVCIPNGIVCHPPTLPKRRGTVLFLGHFDDSKNADVIVRAMGLLKERGLTAKAYFCGDGDVESHLELVRKLGLEDTCEYLGWVGGLKKQELLNRCSIFCLPSNNEAMPVSLLEAMSNGLAAVVTPVGGMLDIVDDGVTGRFVTPGDERSLANALCDLIEHDDVCARIAESGRQKVVNTFSMDAAVNRVLSLYRGVLKERARHE